MPPGLTLEFQIGDLGQRVEVPELTETLYADLIEKVDEADIVGVQIVPQKWPRKVQILCMHQAAKDCLLIQGLDIYGKHIELNEPGNGVVKVVIQDAPLTMPNDVLKTWVGQFGTVTEFRNEHVVIQGKRTNWRTGTRYAYISMLKQPVPPSAKIPYDGAEVTISAWHYGQTHIKCRWCHTIVPKGHFCERGPKRKCYNCGSEAHVRAECTVGKRCYKCGKDDHIARDCHVENDANWPKMDKGAPKPLSQKTNPPIVEMEETEETQEECDRETELQQKDASSATLFPQIPTVNTLLIGGSNCRNLTLPGDDNLHITLKSSIQGGLRISEAAEKLEEFGESERTDFEAVIVHVGSCEFPVNDLRESEEKYTHYVELLNSITTNCPHAKIILSSVLPRAGNGKANINTQIKEFNEKLARLAIDEENIFFCDNYIHFETSQGVDKSLYRQSEKAGLHVNCDGRTRLAASIGEALKEAYFKVKLEDELLL